MKKKTNEKNFQILKSLIFRRNSEAHALREVREQLKKDLLRYQGNQVTKCRWDVVGNEWVDNDVEFEIDSCLLFHGVQNCVGVWSTGDFVHNCKPNIWPGWFCWLSLRFGMCRVSGRSSPSSTEVDNCRPPDVLSHP